MIGPAAKPEPEAPLCLPPLPLTRQPVVRLPHGTVDTHFHVFKQGAPLNTPRSYTPQIATLNDWQHVASSTGIARGVLVQPSVYGLDNSVLLEALAADPANLRGVVVLPPETSRHELRRLDTLGIRGVRINTRNKGGLPFDAVTAFAAPLADLGWTLQVQVRPEQLTVITDLAPTLGTPVVIDHLGFIALGAPESQSQVDDLRRLLDTGLAYVKLSAPYRLGQAAEFAAIARSLTQSHPERLLWGTDWPHTELWAEMPDDIDLVDAAFGWLATDAVRRAVFIDNPQSLFF